MVVTNTFAQQHYIRTDILGYFTPYFNGLYAEKYREFTPVKYSLGYEYLLDSSNQSMGVQINYGSNHIYIIDFGGATETFNNITGFFIQPDYRYYLGKNSNKFKLFGNVGGLIHHGKLNSNKVLLPERSLMNKETKTVNAVGLTFGGGMKYTFSKRFYSELLFNLGFPLYRTPVITDYYPMFFRLELGVGYHFNQKKF